ncbi:hypothetical protein LEP1GSC123_4352 [Leptospira borgpetersenii str. 200701203]|uniref:Uncharacterized protein n=1 Tax=Leptospira borgpetersenii str. 200701203 TaxID=1193007 RepID=M3GYR7_LEPBO|nr:hypothetical protein LEP1GSC123_4352 [Leptospira borgpetersenii str. 200701203]
MRFAVKRNITYKNGSWNWFEENRQNKSAGKFLSVKTQKDFKM